VRDNRDERANELWLRSSHTEQLGICWFSCTWENPLYSS